MISMAWLVWCLPSSFTLNKSLRNNYYGSKAKENCGLLSEMFVVNICTQHLYFRIHIFSDAALFWRINHFMLLNKQSVITSKYLIICFIFLSFLRWFSMIRSNASASSDGTVKIWDCNQWHLLYSFDGHRYSDHLIFWLIHWWHWYIHIMHG